MQLTIDVKNSALDYFISNAMKNISGARMLRITTKYIKDEANIPLPPQCQ